MQKILLTLLFIFATSVLSFSEELTVAVASNVQFTFEELKSVFEKETGITIKDTIGSSGKFCMQIENGAPFDVFLSADMDYPEKLEEKGFTLNAPKIYAYGKLVIWTMNDLDLSKGIAIVTDAAIKNIAVATIQTAPYGREAVNVLKHYNLYSQINDKLVYGESLSQANQFIFSKAADLGFTAKSVVLSSNMKNQGKWIEVKQDAYEPIAQGAVILKSAQTHHLVAAQRFFDFLFSEKARAIFEKYGYSLPR